MTLRVVAVTGISGVGKSTLLGRLAETFAFEHLQAGALIKQGRDASDDVEVEHDRLRLFDIGKNQEFLIQGFKLSVHAKVGLIVLDGHTVIERDEGLIRIDPRVFAAMGINGMIFLTDDPEAIAIRRGHDTERTRPLYAADRLQLIQEEAQIHATTICRNLGVPLYLFRPEQVALISRTLRGQ